ncbi:MAG: SDR family oxidoreductase [Nitrospirae bacterium]|nr:SDR family oxidoreductase [Nitrospirota bacterium]MBF0592298.1 SDR family oxidoreductase [Nitrospirota bacterium]
MSFLGLDNKTIVVFGVRNKKSIAYHTATLLQQEGAQCLFVVRDEAIKAKVSQLFPNNDIFLCDVKDQRSIEDLYISISSRYQKIDGMLHAIAFANISSNYGSFHEMNKNDFLEAIDISCFSLTNLANTFKGLFNTEASVVTLSVPFTRIAVECYGYMAPVKAALESSVVYLAKSFSNFSNVRFNVVASGFLKTTSAAGVPGFVANYIYSEKTNFRKRALDVSEIADVIVYLLSKRSTAINGQIIVSDAGTMLNPYDKEILDALLKNQNQGDVNG